MTSSWDQKFVEVKIVNNKKDFSFNVHRYSFTDLTQPVNIILMFMNENEGEALVISHLTLRTTLM